MIKVVTLDTGNEQSRSTKGLHTRIAQLQLGEIDVLCCQGISRSGDVREDEIRIVSESLGMSYSHFIANHQRSGRLEGKTNGVSGLAILTGAGTWALNSGSFPVLSGSDETEGAAQFALVRKNGASILVLNLQFCGSRHVQLLQLRALFSHPMLRERYGAVVLCGDQQADFTAQQLRTVTGMSNYLLHHDSASSTISLGEGVLCMLIARERPMASVTLCSPGLRQASDPDNPTLEKRPMSLSLDFEMDRIPQNKNKKSCFPLSVEEHWSGYKGNFPAFAV